MNNFFLLLVKFYEKYDLKGSMYKRKVFRVEWFMFSFIFKDLDFMNNYFEGILLEKDKYDVFIKII